MIDPELAHDIVKAALGTGGAFADVFCQRRSATQIRFEDKKVDDISSGIDSGAGVRVIKGDLAAYAHTDILDADHLTRAARAAAEALGHGGDGTSLVVKVTSRRNERTVCDTGGAHEIPAVVDYLASCDDAARSLGNEVRQVTAVHAGSVDEQLLVNSLGEVGESTCQRTRLVVQVVAGRNGLMQVGMEAPGGLGGSEFYERIIPADAAVTAGRRALIMLDAGPPPTGKMAVVINSGTGGVLLHEACGHGLEVDHVQRGASVYAGKLGGEVANPLVGAIDNPTIGGLWGSYDFDDEGIPSEKTVLIEEGILRNYLYGRHEAMKEGRESTGNGRRQSFRFNPIPRMSNTYIEQGESEPEEIVASTKHGLYARKMGGGEVDPTTGDYVFAVSEGYLIEGGKLGAAVRGATLIGNGPRTLEIIDAVGNDLSFNEGTCGKDNQGVPVTTGCPTFRIAELTVGGTQV